MATSGEAEAVLAQVSSPIEDSSRINRKAVADHGSRFARCPRRSRRFRRGGREYAVRATARVIWDTHAPVIMFRSSPASSAAASAGFASGISVVSGFCFRWRAFVRLVCDFRRVAMLLAHEWLGNAERVDFPKWRRQTIGRCSWMRGPRREG